MPTLGLWCFLAANSCTQSDPSSKDTSKTITGTDVRIAEAVDRLTVLRELLSDRIALAKKVRIELRKPGVDHEVSLFCLKMLIY